ncbi:hypothetical protein, partial [Streptomyces sp. NPDC059538]|uniref:hypothetical protein n=1 Tax=Streptomyces sp. NPDC059538 TaxID=3346860 RepID=UPI0036B5C726
MSPATARGGGPLLLGVRHHGPGSARAVRAALDAARPAAVLIEGPPEGDALLARGGAGRAGAPPGARAPPPPRPAPPAGRAGARGRRAGGGAPRA